MLSKPELRQKIILQRNQLILQAKETAQFQHINQRLHTYLMQFPSKKVGAFWPTSQEINIRPTLEKLQATHALALPKVTTTGLSFHAFTTPQALTPNKYGIEEPPMDAPHATPNIILTPLLAYDIWGYRLGYGGGYYDRAFAGPYKDALKIGIGLSCFQYEKLPIDKHDVKLDLLINEKEILEFRDI